MLCGKNFLGDATHMSTYPRQGAHDRLRYGYHRSPAWWTNGLYLGLLTEVQWVVTSRSRNVSNKLHHQGPPQHGRQLRNPGTWSPLNSLQAAPQVILSSCLRWSKPLPSSSDGCCFFQAAVWSRSLLCSLTYLRGTSTFSSFSEEPRNSRQFQGLLKGFFFFGVFCCFVVVVLVIYLFTFLFKKLFSSTEFFNLRENYYTTAHGEDIWQNKNMQKGKNCTTAHW